MYLEKYGKKTHLIRDVLCCYVRWKIRALSAVYTVKISNYHQLWFYIWIIKVKCTIFVCASYISATVHKKVLRQLYMSSGWPVQTSQDQVHRPRLPSQALRSAGRGGGRNQRSGQQDAGLDSARVSWSRRELHLPYRQSATFGRPSHSRFR